MTDLFDLSGTTAVITGSSRGIGLAIARALLGQGAAVLINGYAPEETAAAQKLLSAEYPDRVAALAGDVSDGTFAQQLVDEAVQAFGRIDHVVCNAGIDIIKPAVDYTADEWDRILAVNLRERSCRRKPPPGTGSLSGSPVRSRSRRPSRAASAFRQLTPYAASKGGVNQLVRTLAAEWAVHGIRVNAVAPGYVANIMDSVTAHDDPASDERIATFTPLGRRATVDEIAAPYAFLASRAAGLRHRRRPAGRRRLHRDLKFVLAGPFLPSHARAWHLMTITCSAGRGCASAGWRWAR